MRLLLIFLLGCSASEPFQSIPPPIPSSEPTTVPITTPITPREHAEVVWKIVDPSVDGFIIKSGPSKDMLVSEIRVLVSDVETLSGNYRYILKDIPVGAPIFISIASFKGSEVSPFSTPQEIR